MVKLFIGGLPPGVTADDLRQRFLPFGEVADCSIAPPKVYGADAVFPRAFGHVELLPKDEASLRKCISAYNGCKWKGAVLKCALAHQHYVQRLQLEEAAATDAGKSGSDRSGGFAAAVDEATDALPPLGPGTVLYLRPPKSAAAVQVALGSGRKLQHFPDPPSLPQDWAGGNMGHHHYQLPWEPLQPPPASGYRYEQLLQRLAANPPPELLALAEERQRHGRQLREARDMQLKEAREAAGAEVAHWYSEDSGASLSWELGSDDDAATAAAAAAAALTSRERRRQAAAAGPHAQAGSKGPNAMAAKTLQQQPQKGQQMQQRHMRREAQARLRAESQQKTRELKVVDSLQEAGQVAAVAAREGPRSAATADLRRFESDSDTEWAKLPVASKNTERLQHQNQYQNQHQHKALQHAGTVVSGQHDCEQDHLGMPLEDLPTGSSGSSGGSELEEWLAAGGGVDGGSAGSEPAVIVGVYSGSEGAATSGSSGGSELEEWLAEAEGGCDSRERDEQEDQGGDAEDSDRMVREVAAQPQQAAVMNAVNKNLGRQEGHHQCPRHLEASPQVLTQQQRVVVDFVEGDDAAVSGRQWWQKPAPAMDLGRFDSSSDGEGGLPAAPAALATAGGQQLAQQQGRQQQQQPHQHHSRKKRRQERVIPQVDGAADSDSSSSEDEESGSGSEESSSSANDGSTGCDDGGEGAAGGPASLSGGGSLDSSSSEASESSTSEEDAQGEEAGKPNLGRQQLGGCSKASVPPNTAPACDGSGGGKDDSGDLQGEGEEQEEPADDYVDAAASAAAATAQEQTRRLAALFPEGAAFRRSEPLAQIEATWRVSRESLVQDYRQKHRQAARMLGRSRGGSGKRQRKS